MGEPHKIPSASIEGIDLKAIESVSPSAAMEIERIGDLLDRGMDDTSDIIRLCELLFTHGETKHSEELLRCNIVEEGDDCYQAYRRLHGFAADKDLEESISAFSQQFGVSLTLIRKVQFLKKEFESSPLRIPIHIDPAISEFLRTCCVVQFEYCPEGSIADVYSKAPDFSGLDYILVQYSDGLWKAKR